MGADGKWEGGRFQAVTLHGATVRRTRFQISIMLGVWPTRCIDDRVLINDPKWEVVHASRSGTNSFPTCRRANSELESRREAHNMSDPRAR